MKPYISDLHKLFEDIYYYKVEKFKTPNQKSHNKVNTKIIDFVNINETIQGTKRSCITRAMKRLSPAKDVV